jgi:O-antigen/teichoic acid export membrane protein
VSNAFSLLLVPVYVRHLRPNEYGRLALLSIVLTLTVIVLKFGLDQAFFRNYYETEDPLARRRIVGSSIIFLAVISALFISLLYLVAPQISALVFSGTSDRTALLRLIFIISFFEVITTIPNSILRANFRSIRFSVLSLISLVVQLAAILYLVLWVDSSVESVLKGRLVGTAFEALLFFFAVRRELSLKFSFAELGEMLSFGWPLIFNQIGSTLFIMIDRFFLEKYTDDIQVGIYALANTFISVVAIIAVMPFGQVWTVMRFSVMKDDSAKEYYSRVLTYIAFVSMTLALGVASVAGDGVLLYASRGYWAVAAILPALALSAVLDSASRVLNVGITLKRRTLYAPIVIFAALGFNVALNFLLIPRYGVWGATVSTLISYFAFCALRFWASNLFIKIDYEWRRIFTILIVGALLISSFYLIDYLRQIGQYKYEDPARRTLLFVSIGAKALLAISFPLILFALRFYDERERRRLSEIWQKISFALRHRKWPQVEQSES